MAKYNNGQCLTISGIKLPVFSIYTYIYIYIYIYGHKQMNQRTNKQTKHKQTRP